MKDYKSAIIAKGLHNEESAIIKCIEFDDKQEIQVLLNDHRKSLRADREEGGHSC